MIGSDTTIPRLTDTISGVLIGGRMRDFAVVWASGSFKENEHGSMSLYVSSTTRTTDFDILPGQRIEFDFGTRGNTMKFQGYVAGITPHNRLSEDHVIDEQEIQCLGESMVFKGNYPRFFTEVTCTEVIARIVGESNLGFIDEFRRDETTWRSLAQTDQTDWEMIVSMATRIGATVICNRGVVRLLDYQDRAARLLPSRVYFKQALPAFTMDDLLPNGILLDFTPTNQASIDPYYTTSSLAYMANGESVEVPAPSSGGGRFTISNYVAKVPARTMQEAQTLQSGFYIPPWVQDAEVRVMGDATVAPATTVRIVSRGGRPDFDGVWYVKSVSHQVVSKTFTTTLTVGRPDQRAPNTKAEFPFWMGDQRGVPSLLSSGTGQWISTWRQSL